MSAFTVMLNCRALHDPFTGDHARVKPVALETGLTLRSAKALQKRHPGSWIEKDPEE